MNTNRAKKLSLVLRVVEKELLFDSLKIKDLVQQLQHHKHKLTELECYSDDYQQKIADQQMASSVESLVSYRGFYQYLMSAMNEQKKVITQLNGLLAQQNMLWQQKNFKKNKIQELMCNALLQEKIKKENKEQQNIDDISGRRKID